MRILRKIEETKDLKGTNDVFSPLLLVSPKEQTMWRAKQMKYDIKVRGKRDDDGIKCIYDTSNGLKENDWMKNTDTQT